MADFTALGAELVRLGTKKDSIETEIRALDDDILILQRQRGDKISELSRVQEEQRTTFESFKTHSAASTEPGIPSLPQHESPTTAATQKKPSQLPVVLPAVTPGQKAVHPASLQQNNSLINGKTPAASVNSSGALKTDVLEDRTMERLFPTVVKIGDKYFEIWCKDCGANIDATTNEYFLGFKGVRSHHRNVHNPRAPPYFYDYYKRREVSNSDVELMQNGEDPQDVPIQPTFGTFLYTNKRDSGALLWGRGKNDTPTKGLTEYEKFKRLERAAAASVAHGWTSPSSGRPQKRRKTMGSREASEDGSQKPT